MKVNLSNQFSLQGKVALVTGSLTNIGRCAAQTLAQAGAKVWLHGRNKDLAHQMAGELNGDYLVADFEYPDQVQAAIDKVLKCEKQLDILINNAGIEVPSPVDSIDLELFDRMMQVNVKACMQLVSGLSSLLKASGNASVINITSIHETVPYSGNVLYSMSKAALAMYSKTAAIELAPWGIRVNNLAPGAILTDINHKTIDHIGKEVFQQSIPLKRIGNLDDLSGSILFLASDMSTYMTGSTLVVDGGYMQNLVRYSLQEAQ